MLLASVGLIAPEQIFGQTTTLHNMPTTSVVKAKKGER
jgi:hypothetical protein